MLPRNAPNRGGSRGGRGVPPLPSGSRGGGAGRGSQPSVHTSSTAGSNPSINQTTLSQSGASQTSVNQPRGQAGNRRKRGSQALGAIRGAVGSGSGSGGAPPPAAASASGGGGGGSGGIGVGASGGGAALPPPPAASSGGGAPPGGGAGGAGSGVAAAASGGGRRGNRRGRGGAGANQGRNTRLPAPAIQGSFVLDNQVQTIGVRRPNIGTKGIPVKLEVNSFELTTEENNISHYDVVTPDVLSGKRKFALFQHMQEQYPNIFTPKLVYDGQKMAYGTHTLDFGQEDARQFQVAFPRSGGGGDVRPPQVFNIILTKVATINTEILRRFTDGKQAWDEGVSTALMAYNIALRTDPQLKNPYRGRSFYIDSDRRMIGGGFEVWRGIFQSVRPTLGRLIVTIDLTATIMYREGPLIHLINEFFNQPYSVVPTYMTPGQSRFPTRYDWVRLKRFLQHVRVTVNATTGDNRPRAITGITDNGADREMFADRAGTMMSVAQYFDQVIGSPLKYPGVICVMLGPVARVPIEMCTVLPGQFVGRSVDIGPNQVSEVLKFSTKKPVERLAAIKQGIQALQFGQSNYIAQFGMSINERPIQVTARVIEAPSIQYSNTGAQGLQVPNKGAWNMLDKKFIVPASIPLWGIAIYESPKRFKDADVKELVVSFRKACIKAGITFPEVQGQIREPVIRKIINPMGNTDKQLREIGTECIQKFKMGPSLLLVVLPQGSNDLYRAIKHFGDVTAGVPTQCLMAGKCTRAKEQYWANVVNKVNVKLGGINSILKSDTMDYITDPRNPVVVFGADVIHPPPGPRGPPSFTAVVGSVDSNASKYVEESRVQEGRQEIIEDLQDMVKGILLRYKDYRKTIEKKPANELNPSRLLFYRDGVSEGQFQHVLDRELPLIRAACEELGMQPKITLIVVGKRHHNQMYPMNNKDKNYNAAPGTVIDTGITHPTEFDFILQSHAGILGTSRPAHYSVLHDETGFNADSLQSLSYALCHVYAPATRSVSIPAPVYYADIVCERSKTRFHPGDKLGMSDTGTQASSGPPSLDEYKKAYKPIHPNQQGRTYFA